MAFAALFHPPNSVRDFRSPDPNAFAALFVQPEHHGDHGDEDPLPSDVPNEERLLTRSEGETQRRRLGCRGVVPWVSASCALLLLIMLSRTLVPATFEAFTLESWEDELPTCNEFPKLDFLWVAHSNLNNMGPDDGPEGLVYRVRSYKGEHMEMVFNAVHDFQAFDSKLFGLHGFYGSLNVMELSHAHIRVTFRDWETKQRVKMEEFAMTFYDIDQGFAQAGIEEVTIEGDWTVAILSKQTGIDVLHSPHFRRIKFKSTLPGMAMDSPTHPLTLTQEQFKKAVTVRFDDVDSFEMTMRVMTPGAHHRFFEFAGEASILCAHLPWGGDPPVGKAYWNPKKHAAPGLVPRKPFETVAITKHKWLFEGWKVKEGAVVRPHDAVLVGTIVFGVRNGLFENETLRSPDNGTVTQLLPYVRVGDTILPDVGVAIIAFPVIQPPGLVVSEKTRGAYDVFAITHRAYRVAAFHVTSGAHVSAGDTIFSGYPVIGEGLGSKVDVKATASGRAQNVLTLTPGHFVLKDVVLMQLRPLVLYPPGLNKRHQKDHIVKNFNAFKFDRWKVQHGSHVKRGQAILIFHHLGDGRRYVLKSNVSGYVDKLVHVRQGEIVDAHVGLVRMKVTVKPRPQVGNHHKASTALATTTTFAGPVGPMGPVGPTVHVMPGSQQHLDGNGKIGQEWDWTWPVIGLGAVGIFGLLGAILFLLWPQAPPPPAPPGPPPKPEVISITTSEEVTVNNGGLSTKPTDQHYTHVTHVRHHHHAHH